MTKRTLSGNRPDEQGKRHREGILLAALEAALLSAARKRYGGRTNVHLTIDPKTCNITAYETKIIVDKVSDKDMEISKSDVKKLFLTKQRRRALTCRSMFTISAG